MIQIPLESPAMGQEFSTTRSICTKLLLLVVGQNDNHIGRLCGKRDAWNQQAGDQEAGLHHAVLVSQWVRIRTSQEMWWHRIQAGVSMSVPGQVITGQSVCRTMVNPHREARSGVFDLAVVFFVHWHGHPEDGESVAPDFRLETGFTVRNNRSVAPVFAADRDSWHRPLDRRWTRFNIGGSIRRHPRTSSPEENVA